MFHLSFYLGRQKSSEGDGGDGCTTLRMCFIPLNYTLRKGSMRTFTLYAFYHNFRNGKQECHGPQGPEGERCALEKFHSAAGHLCPPPRKARLGVSLGVSTWASPGDPFLGTHDRHCQGPSTDPDVASEAFHPRAPGRPPSEMAAATPPKLPPAGVNQSQLQVQGGRSPALAAVSQPSALASASDNQQPRW